MLAFIANLNPAFMNHKAKELPHYHPKRTFVGVHFEPMFPSPLQYLAQIG